MAAKLGDPGRDFVNYHKYTTSLLGEPASYFIMYLIRSVASTTYLGMTNYVIKSNNQISNQIHYLLACYPTITDAQIKILKFYCFAKRIS
jgi:hypothetical protein